MEYKRNLVKNGGSLSLNFPADVVRFLEWGEKTRVVLTVTNKQICISKEGDKNGI